MAVNGNGHGQSLTTAEKERRIGSGLSIGMKIANAKFKGYSFWHLDANAGSGHNDEFDVPGSPLVAWDAARQYLNDMRFKAFFCDNNPISMETLKATLKPEDLIRSTMLCMDNDQAVKAFSEAICNAEKPNYAVGSILIDPNGYWYKNQKLVGAPVESMKWFCKKHDRIDVILNINTRSYNLQVSQNHDVMPPRDVLASFDKKYWLVSLTGGKSRFLLAIGRNVKTNAHPGLDLFDSESPQGKAILNGFLPKLLSEPPQPTPQPSLFGDLP